MKLNLYSWPQIVLQLIYTLNEVYMSLVVNAKCYLLLYSITLTTLWLSPLVEHSDFKTFQQDDPKSLVSYSQIAFLSLLVEDVLCGAPSWWWGDSTVYGGQWLLWCARQRWPVDPYRTGQGWHDNLTCRNLPSLYTGYKRKAFRPLLFNRRNWSNSRFKLGAKVKKKGF